MIPLDKVVYVHKLGDEIVYVGYGNKSRVTSKSGRSVEHKAVWENLSKVVIHCNLTKDDATQIEFDLISKLTSKGILLFNKVKHKTIVKDVIYETISKILEYDETSSTGLRWKVNKSHRSKIGGKAGYVSNRYIKLTIDSKTYMGHRMIFCLLTKKDLDNSLVIDHIDRNGLNNAIDNLREVTQQANTRNRKYRVNNTTGEQSVGEQSHLQRFMVRWTVNSHRHIKYFSYNPNKHKSNKSAFVGKDSAFTAAIEFRNSLVIQNIITLIGD
jgi:hypothetical protein